MKNKTKKLYSYEIPIFSDINIIIDDNRPDIDIPNAIPFGILIENAFANPTNVDKIKFVEKLNIEMAILYKMKFLILVEHMSKNIENDNIILHTYTLMLCLIFTR